jgi:hypothetical protein
MNAPTFAPGQTVWHVRHGKVTLLKRKDPNYPVMLVRDNGVCLFRANGTVHPDDVGRILYTLEEAVQYGWYKPEPLVVEFETIVTDWKAYMGSGWVQIPHKESQSWYGKRVLVTVKEITE